MSAVRVSGASRRRAAVVVLGAALLVGVVGGCGPGDDDQDAPTDVERAEREVAAREEALAEAHARESEASLELCTAAVDYVTALDRYGDVLTDTAPTVGDVVAGGSDLQEPRDDVLAAGESAQEARRATVEAQLALDEAVANLAALQQAAGEDVEIPEVTPGTPEPLADADDVGRVRQADAEFTAAQEGIDADTPLVQATQQFNAAAVALEMAWLRLVGGSGCLDDERLAEAQATAAAYTLALQQSLTDAGYDPGPVDGVYGPQTVAAVEALQEAHGLPVTGTVDKATDAALQADLAAKGGAAAQSALVSTTALQQTLHLAGYWDGPVDGQWTPELTTAVMTFQTDLGVPATGTVDAATVAAFDAALAASRAPAPTEEPEPGPEESEEGDA